MIGHKPLTLTLADRAIRDRVIDADRPLVARARERWDRSPALRERYHFRFDLYLRARREAERQGPRL